MVFRLEKEIVLLREEVFQQLPHSRQEKRQYLLQARNLLWTLTTELAFGETNRQKLLNIFDEALTLVFCSFYFNN
jgi:hypothetical protein